MSSSSPVPGPARDAHRSRRVTGHWDRRGAEIWSFLYGLGRDALTAVRAWPWWKWALLAALIAVALYVMVVVRIPPMEQLRVHAAAFGPWFVVLFWCCYVIFTLFPIPRTLWTVTAGLLFGPWVGMAIALTALTCSASLAMSVVRRILGEWMRPRLKHPAVANLNERLAQRGWLAIVSLRMIGAVPFSVVNYAAGLTPVPLYQFAAATLLGSIPTTALGVFFGDSLTGHMDPWLIAAMAVLAVFGLTGLYLDHRLPTRAPTPDGQA